MIDLSFFTDKKVLITGHTGFKGSWLCKILLNVGANVTGYALKPPTEPNLFSLSGVGAKMHSVMGDIRNLESLKAVFEETKPEIVIHMAAQPIVRASYENPVYTYDVNVMGTVNMLECVRCCSSVKSFLNVTTDKVYLNREWEWGYRENEELNGYDPYSNSKSCSELVTSSYKNSFFQNREIGISTARAGNVIGGGDFANDRIIPDCVRALCKKEKIVVRNPYSIRPYQHVLEPLSAYLMLMKTQYENPLTGGCYNVGPDEKECYETGKIVDLFCRIWNEGNNASLSWESIYEGGPHEAGCLRLDNAKIKQVIGWIPRWNTEIAIKKVIEWIQIYLENGDIAGCMDKQIWEYFD